MSGTESLTLDSDLKDFILMEQEKAQFNQQIHELNSVCWTKCIDKPSTKLESKTESCISNCVNRFIDVSTLISTRYANALTKNIQQLDGMM